MEQGGIKMKKQLSNSFFSLFQLHQIKPAQVSIIKLELFFKAKYLRIITNKQFSLSGQRL